jgi:hypothetical protein
MGNPPLGKRSATVREGGCVWPCDVSRWVIGVGGLNTHKGIERVD